MKKISLQYLRDHSNIENVIDGIAPDLLKAGNDSSVPYGIFVETVEQAPFAISITDKKANILYVNEEFTRVTGYQASDVLGENESILSDKSTPRHVYYDLWHTISRKRVWHGRLINRHKQGDRYLSDLTIAPMLDDNGTITHYIGMHRDITESYEAEKRVHNQKLLIESVINASPIAMVVLDSEDRIILDNHMYKALVSDLDKGEPAHYFMHLLRGEMGGLWHELQEQQQGFSNREFRVECKGRHSVRWFSCAGNWFVENEVNADAFFENSSKQYLILTLTDITQQRRQMEELHIQTLKALMADDERIRGMRETLLGAMHQIQMPMNQIRAAEQILNHRGDTQQSYLLDVLREIQRSGEEAIATMQNCIPEIVQSAVVPVNLNRILHEILLLSSQRLLGHDIEVDWQPLLDLPSILGSENRLRMLFKQLVDNAIDALDLVPSQDRWLKVMTGCDSELVYVCIQDTGPGIPEDKRAKVFEPFYTTRPGNNQAGMGLVMVKEIVSQHQGVITIDENYSQGCRFIINFPIHKKPQRGES